MDAVVKYIDGLLEKSTPDAPVWNIEKIKQGLKSKWNYIDGCMIKAVLQMYDLMLMLVRLCLNYMILQAKKSTRKQQILYIHR